jgi:hypothetical protein
MKTIALMLALLFSASVSLNAMAADSNDKGNDGANQPDGQNTTRLIYPAPKGDAANAASGGSITWLTVGEFAGGTLLVLTAAAIAEHGPSGSTSGTQ